MVEIKLHDPVKGILFYTGKNLGPVSNKVVAVPSNLALKPLLANIRFICNNYKEFQAWLR